MGKYKVAVVGGSGYSGLELLKILLRHPAARCEAVVVSELKREQKLSDIHPSLRGLTEAKCLAAPPEAVAEMGLDTVFLCTPNEVSHEWVPVLHSRGLRVIDLSGSFRLSDGASYPRWYGYTHAAPELLSSAVYGLSEWDAEAIRGARLIANPGCYATSALLALLPVANRLDPDAEIFCDAKSGVTGAGRKPKLDLLFGEVAENFRPYSPVSHRHVPEICQRLGWRIEQFTFVPHLLPISRGILSTLYVSFRQAVTQAEIESDLLSCYRSRPFLRILHGGRLPETLAVANTNFCDLACRVTSSGRSAILFSAIDNLGKGAAGQAVQNFNLMHGLDETTGLGGKVTIAADD
jgi:N-acetyl-gamma-glutamyl-phosphate reductase